MSLTVQPRTQSLRAIGANRPGSGRGTPVAELWSPIEDTPASEHWPHVVNANFLLGEAGEIGVQLTDDQNEIVEPVYYSGPLPSGVRIQDSGGPGSRQVKFVYDGSGAGPSSASGYLIATDGSYLRTKPTWQDEADAYAARGLTLDSSTVWTNGGDALDIDSHHTTSHKNAFSFATNPPGWSTNQYHSILEGDELWLAYHMFKRTNGIRQAAADVWQARMVALKDYFIAHHLTEVQTTGSGTDSSFQHDHMFGHGFADWYVEFGAAEPDGGVDAVLYMDGLIDYLVGFFENSYTRHPDTHPAHHGGSDMRRYPRWLLLADSVYRATGNQTARQFRDLMLNWMVYDPNFDETHQSYFVGPQPTNDAGFDYGAGDRMLHAWISCGIWMNSLIQCFDSLAREGDSRVADIRGRIVGTARFVRDHALEDVVGVSEITTDLLVVPQHFGFNLGTEQRISGNNYGGSFGSSPWGYPNLAIINLLTWGYKLTGDTTYLDTAWLSLRQRYKAHRLTNGETNVEDDMTITHYQDSVMTTSASPTLLAYNKTEMFYAGDLMENGGNPSVIWHPGLES
jgi:hypothetical protein